METKDTNSENLDLDIKDTSGEVKEENKDFLDIDLGEEKKEGDTASEKPAFNIKTVGIVIVLLLPVIWIIYKTMGNSSKQEQAGTSTQQIDVAAYENAAKANPTFSNLLNLSNAYINSGTPAKAVESLQKALELNPNSAIALSNLGFAHSCMQQYKEGIYYGEKAVALDTTFLLAKNNLAWAKTEYQKMLNALAEIEQISEDKRDIPYYTSYGLLLLRLEEYAKSVEIWNKMLTIEPKNGVALTNKGVAYMSLYEYDKAIQSFQQVVDNNANDQFAKNNLNWALGEKKKSEEAAAVGVQGQSEKKAKK